MDPRADKVAEVMVNYSVEVQPNDLVLIRILDPLAEPLALEVEKHVLKAGGHPMFLMAPSRSGEIFFKYAGDEQLDWVNPMHTWLWEKVDVMISLLADANTKEMSNVDPARLSRVQKARAPLSKIFMKRQAAGNLRWTLTQYPTQAAAQDAEMSLSEYEDFVYGACMVHLKDPVVYWRKISAEQERLVQWLDGKNKVEVKGEHVDLTLSITGRKFINADGKKNFPDGEIFTGPVEDSVNGWAKFTYPAIYNGREVDSVELTFEKGKVVKATADKGEDFLNATLDTDSGARYLGEFAVGTNAGIKQFTRNILFDEKMGGTIHMAVGASYPDTGGKNESAVHWDMICDMRSGGEIYVDGELFYKNGKFQI
ncbi:MAG: aminopeptidase [Anaerolineae bacterium]|nr:aminopeptidase [Anaerolineae bacterium]